LATGAFFRLMHGSPVGCHPQVQGPRYDRGIEVPGNGSTAVNTAASVLDDAHLHYHRFDCLE